MRTILDEIFDTKRRRVADERNRVDLAQLAETARAVRSASRSGVLRAALQGGGVNIIAEFKRASPSKGVINDSSDAADVARQYEMAGARAISVLTEEDFFMGSLEDLRKAREAVSLPILRKDFTFHEFQIYEAAAAGADAILLIVSSLDADRLRQLRLLAEDELGMDALVEVHTADEMTIAADIGAMLIGVNNRNLRTFDVSLDVSRELVKLAPSGATLVAESGLSKREDLAELRSLGYSGFLIGETLMRSGEPEHELRELTRIHSV
jgi:indole-3-glycerol phosphate synthase